jgi:opacity protein-like surface antigen
MNHIKYFCISILLLPITTESQSVFSRNRQYEVGLNVGAMFFLGDIQGNKGVGKPFLKDLNPNNTKIYQGGFFTYYPKYGRKGFGIRIMAGMGVVHGADSLIRDYGGDELSRKKRNLSFKSDLQEIAVNLEYHITLGKIRPYLATGIGLVRFSTKTEYGGSWVKLAPLMTEGIRYPTIAACFPIGFGLKYMTENNRVLTIEILHRHTTTDYIDDVSTVYTSNQLSFRETLPRNDYIGEQRGDPSDKDNYFTVVIKQSLKCPEFY